MKAYLPIRGDDKHGSGHYGAPRGKRIHKGIDFACVPGTAIYPMYPGVVTKLGFPYAKHTDIRYVQVMDDKEINHRYFYVYPVVELNDWVDTDTVIGVTQELYMYPGITEHCHYEVQNKQGEYLDPRDFIIPKEV